MYEEQYEKQHYEMAFERAILFATEGLGGERVIAMYNGNGKLHGFEAERLWTTEPLSLSTLEKAVTEAKDVIILAAMDSSQALSIQITGVKCVMFIPLENSDGVTCGFVYVDSRISKGVLKPEDLEQMRSVVEGTVQPMLHRVQACRPLNWQILQETCWL